MEKLSGYKNLSKEQEDSLSAAITEKIQSLISVHGLQGDIDVLVEYITVMLQSAKQHDAIENELQAFLQDQSKPFVMWLGQKIQALNGKVVAEGSPGSADSPKSQSPRRARSRSPAKKKPAVEKTRRPGGIAGSLFGRAVRDAQRSLKSADGGQERPSPGQRKGTSSLQDTPPAEKPKLKARTPPSAGAGRSSQSRSRSRSRQRGPSPPAPTSGAEKALLQASPRVRGRAGALAAAVADAAASTANPSGTRTLPPRPRRAPPLPPPPRALPMHMAPGVHAGIMSHPEDARFAHDGRWGPPPLPHGAVPFHGGLAPGPPPAHAPPQPGPPPLGPPPAAAASASSSQRRGKARLAPVKLEDGEDDSRWHFQAAPGQPAAGPPPSVPPPVALTPASIAVPLPNQVTSGAPGFSTWTQVAGPPPTSTPAAASSAARARAAPPPVASTVFEFQQTPATTQVASTPPVQPQKSVSAPPRPRNFVPQKWRVVTTDLVVGSSEHLESKEVRTLREGEIVESVGPPFTLTNGVIRLEIRHPSSAAYPNPIGWVTQDDTAKGGAKNLEPGPQPVQATVRPGTSQPPSYKGGWRPKGKGKGGGKASFTNVTWRPP